MHSLLSGLKAVRCIIINLLPLIYGSAAELMFSSFACEIRRLSAVFDQNDQSEENSDLRVFALVICETACFQYSVRCLTFSALRASAPVGLATCSG